ncbi:MAG: hypothetical protein V1774_01550 [Candidatus Eisenbacteria bacterium]
MSAAPLFSSCPRARAGEHRGCTRTWPVVGLVLLLALISGCGYTVLKGHQDALPSGGGSAVSDSSHADGLVLPPGHPPVDVDEIWIGRSFLDRFVGEDDALRFENLREDPHAFAPAHHATITVRITLGGPAVADIWQIGMDEFGWVTASSWMQGAAGPMLDEANATFRTEFRLERQSEAALRAMIIELLPKTADTTLRDWPATLNRLPPEWWPYTDAGLIEIEYHLENLGLVDPDDWPGGRVSAPLDVIQLLIGTWDSPPPRGLQRDARQLIDLNPSIANIALIAEAIVLAWEVEGQAAESIDLPLWVGR